MASEFPLVSIITVNYNAPDDTLEFLKSVKELTYPNLEIIVVDNASKVDPGAMIATAYPDVIYIRSEQNLGFAGGNNLGIKIAKGDYLFFLNNDTLLYHDFMEPIVNFMIAHPDAGMASPMVLYPDGKTIQYAGGIGINPYTGRGKRVGLFEEDRGQYDSSCKTDFGHGAAMIVPRKVITDVGPMPELFFLYYEEHDWVEQVKRAGFNMYYIGTSKVLHKESISTGGFESPLKVYYLTRNRLLFMRRNTTGLPYYIGLIFFVLVSIPKNTLVYLFRGKLKLLKSFYQGIGWNITNYKVA
jgi:GT2 family glycosyltransferase